MANEHEDRGDLARLFDSDIPEYRSVPFTDFEAKDDGWGFEGLAAVYGEPADLGDFTEEFMRGAFRKPLANGDNTRLIYDHAPPYLPVLATIKGGTLQIKDDAKGLVVRGQLAHHYVGEAVRELIRRGDVKGMSPGMIVGQGNSEIARRGGKVHRAIRALKKLPELSLTPDPVYAGTTAELRSLWAMRMVESMDMPQHAFLGAYQQLESRAATHDAGTGTDETVADEPEETPAVEQEVEEQRSGVDAVQTAAAARRRRLQMMGLSLPKDDDTPRPASTVVEERSVAPPPTRDVDEILRYPRETWSPQEKRSVADRQKQVQTELFALVSEAERVGRNLTAEEADTFASLQSEFERLRR
jgi:HK97 family phage prohead protease